MRAFGTSHHLCGWPLSLQCSRAPAPFASSCFSYALLPARVGSVDRSLALVFCCAHSPIFNQSWIHPTSAPSLCSIPLATPSRLHHSSASARPFAFLREPALSFGILPALCLFNPRCCYHFHFWPINLLSSHPRRLCTPSLLLCSAWPACWRQGVFALGSHCPSSINCILPRPAHRWSLCCNGPRALCPPLFLNSSDPSVLERQRVTAGCLLH